MWFARKERTLHLNDVVWVETERGNERSTWQRMTVTPRGLEPAPDPDEWDVQVLPNGELPC